MQTITESTRILINANLDKHGEASFDTYYAHPSIETLRSIYSRPGHAVFEIPNGQIIIKRL